MFSIFVTGHNEQYNLIRSVESVFSSLQTALNTFNFDFRVQLNLDNPDNLTFLAAEKLKRKYVDLKVTASNFNDVALVRNAFIETVSNSFIFFLDGDDHWDSDWIFRFCKLKNKRKDTLYHPEYTIFYDSQEIVVLRSKSDLRLRSVRSRLLIENLWSSSFIAHRDVFDLHKFKCGNTASYNKFAYEDWSFFRDSYYYGLRNTVLKNTTHYHLLKVNSNTKNSITSKQLPHPFEI
jgi:hypothetical protein